MHAFFASTALALAATVTPAAAPATETVQPAVTAPVRADAPRRRHRTRDVSVSQPAQSSDDAELQRQIERHVLMPVLSGDGGG